MFRTVHAAFVPAALLTTTLIGLNAVASASATPARTAGTPECGVAGLSVHITQGSPGAGNRYARLTLSNTSSHACRTGGWVGLGLQNASGHPVATHVRRADASAARTLVLAPHASASSLLRWGAVQGTGDRHGGPCFVAPQRVLVTPPNSYRSLDIAWNGGIVCESGAIDVTPLRA